MSCPAIRIYRQIWRDITGATAMEYGLIAGAIAIVIVGSIALLGGQVAALFQLVVDAFGG